MDESSLLPAMFQQARISGDEVRDPGSLSPIEQLPRELVWKIIECEPESVCNLKMTSRILNSRVHEFALERETIPLVGILEIGEAKNSAKRENGLTPELIKLCVPMSKSNLFELRVKNYQLQRNLKRIFIDETMLEYQLEVDLLKTGDIQRVQELRDCVGKRVGTLIVDFYWRESSALPFVYYYLSGIQFNSLKIEELCMTAEQLNALPSIVRDHKINHISLRLAVVSSHDTVDILRQLSSLVASMYLHQRNAYHNRTRNYVFGVSGADWGQIIIDMFSRKVDKLLIDNEFFPEYLPKEAADRLVETLPTMGKKLWFEASCRAYKKKNELNYKINECNVRAHGCALMIKHSTREKEKKENV